MKCFVTGASGFIGSNLVHALNADGHEVKALLRKGCDLRALRGAEYEAVEGELSDPSLLSRSMRGCEWCFHVAASYHLWLPDYRPMYAANVDGTRNVIEAAIQSGCSRIVYTSTVGCIGLPKAKGGVVEPTHESSPVSGSQMTNHYKKSKWLAEQLALELAQKGAPVVVVNPTAPVGPGDVKPTPTGQFIVDFLNGRMPAFLDTGLNWVHVQDVATGHILAARRGEVGQRYILGNASGNLTMQEALILLGKLTGKEVPRIRIPHVVALMAAHFEELVASVTGKPPRAPLAGVKMAKYKMFFDPGKSIQKLGVPQTPVEKSFQDAIAWFKENSYTKS